MRQPARRRTRKAQGGAAILMAMLTTVLVASLASTLLWQQWRNVEVESAERTRTQAGWLLTGALDWARLILREDARKGGPDHLAEPWAVPLAQARLSTFLAANATEDFSEDATQEAFLSGQIIDLQSRLNVGNVVQGGRINDSALQAFIRLYALFNLPDVELEAMVGNLRLAQGGHGEKEAPADHPLMPRDLDQLVWLGMSPRSLAVLRPYITLLPTRTPVNLNTAPAEVIYASVPGLELADAHRLVVARTVSHFGSLADASKVLGNAAVKFDSGQQGVGSNFFEVRGSLRLNQATVQEHSVVQRTGMNVTVLWRERGAAPAAAPLQ